MGRSIATPHDAAFTAYFEFQAEDSWEWDDLIEDIVNVVQIQYPSFDSVERWAGDELKVIAENRHATLIVSSYCGLVSLSVVPNGGSYYYDPTDNLANEWCGRIENNFLALINKTFNGVFKWGTLSNGVNVYRRGN